MLTTATMTTTTLTAETTRKLVFFLFQHGEENLPKHESDGSLILDESIELMDTWWLFSLNTYAEVVTHAQRVKTLNIVYLSKKMNLCLSTYLVFFNTFEDIICLKTA